MALTLIPTVFYRGQPSTSSTTLYTVSATAGKFALIKNIMICNTSVTSATISMASVASAGSESDSNRFMKDVSVPAKTTVQLDLNMMLANGESLRATASVATTITVVASGVIN